MSSRTPWRAPSRGPRRAALVRPGAALLAVLLLAAGCLEANPLPSPLSETPHGGQTGDETDARGGVDPPPPGEYAYINAALTFVSSLPQGESDGTIIVVGAPGATSKGEAVRVAAENGYERDVTRAPDGGFAAEIQGATPGLEIELTLLVTDDGQGGTLKTEGAPLKVAVGAITTGESPGFFYDGDDDEARDPEPAGDGAWAGGGNTGTPSQGTGFVTVSPPDAAGTARVRSAAQGVTPYAMMLVLNIQDGRSYAGQADNVGAVDVPIRAAVGDELAVFASKPNDPTTSTQSITLIVPPGN
jgi:hypothetical protein